MPVRTLELDDDDQPAAQPARPAPRKSKKTRNWTWFNDEQQARFLKAQKKKGLDGASLLSLAFNEYADKEGL